MPVLNFVVTKDRVLDYVTVDDFILAQQRDFVGIKNVLAALLVDENGKYYEDVEAAKRIVGKLTFRQLNETASKLMGEAEDAMVPPTKGST